jgi:hypothetical protein
LKLVVSNDRVEDAQKGWMLSKKVRFGAQTTESEAVPFRMRFLERG